MTGAAIGGTGGPAAFGVLAAQSYTVAWLFAAALALVAAGFMLLARQAVLRARRPAM